MDVLAFAGFNILQRFCEARSNLGCFLLSHHLHFFTLEVTDLLHRRLMLSFSDDIALGKHSHFSLGGRLSHFVGSAANILASVQGCHTKDIQGYEAKVVVGFEPGADGERSSVEEPFNLHGGITNGLQPGLKMNVLAIADWIRTDKSQLEDWWSSWCNFFKLLLFHLLLHLKPLCLLHCARVHAGVVNLGVGIHIKLNLGLLGSEYIGCNQGVCSRILLLGVVDVNGNIAKVMEGLNTTRG